MQFKKIFYISLFTLFGILVQFFLHAIIEIGYIKLLLTNYEIFGLGLQFSTWFSIHTAFTIVLLILGVGLGFSQGRYWWKRLYVNRDVKR